MTVETSHRLALIIRVPSKRWLILLVCWKSFGIALAFKSSMFDIFTTHADGSPQFVVSVKLLMQAQEMACQLSYVVPGEYFGYFERTQDAVASVSRLEGRRLDKPEQRMPFTCVLSAGKSKKNSDDWRLRDERSSK
jgi:hypothetical protein